MAICACGKRKSRFASSCNACHRTAMLDSARQYLEAERRGTCPHHPDHRLVPNPSLAGSLWLQCLYPFTTAGDAIAATYTPQGGRQCHYYVLCGKDEYVQVLARERV